MFQNTPRTNGFQDPNSQRDEQQKRDQQARDDVAESARRMMSDAQLRSLELQRQNVDGKVEEVRAKERQGVSAQQVADQTKQNTVGDLDFKLGQLVPPTFNEDRRGEIRLAYMRAVDTQAKEIEAKRFDQDEQQATEKRSLVDRERRDRELAFE